MLELSATHYIYIYSLFLNDQRCNVWITWKSNNETTNWCVTMLCCIVGLWLMTRLLLWSTVELPCDCQPDWAYELKSWSERQTAKLDPDVQIPGTLSALLGLQKALVLKGTCMWFHTRTYAKQKSTESPFDNQNLHAWPLRTNQPV